MSFKEKYGPTALIAGGSEGIGAAFAHSLAARGLDLVLVARKKEPLEIIAANIQTKYGVKVTVVCCDLTADDALEQIKSVVKEIPVSFLVYNAALSYIGPYLDENIGTHEAIAKVNIMTPMKLLHYFGGKMVAQGRGGVVVMSSLAGMQGSAYLATYAATKAFCNVFAESLWYEWKQKGVDVISCIAGATATQNYIDTQPGKTNPLAPKPQKPGAVVEECLNKIGRRPSFISGGGNKIASFFMRRILPNRLTVVIMGNNTRDMYRVKP